METPINEHIDQLTFEILVNGSEIKSDYQVSFIEIYKAINRIPTARVYIIDGSVSEEDFPISESSDFVPGTKIEIKAGYEGDNETIFKGIITKQGLKAKATKSPEMQLECKDEAIKMTVGRKNAYFSDSTDSSIINSVIGNYGLDSSVPSTSVTRKEVIQYYATDWDFIVSRGETVGLFTIVDDGKVSVQAPSVSSSPVLGIQFGLSIIEFESYIDAPSQYKKVTSYAWDYSKQEQINSPSQEPSVNEQGNITGSKLSDVIDLDSYTQQSPVPLANDALKAWSNSKLQKSRLSKIKGRFKFQGNAKPKPDTLISISGVGDRFNGDGYVTSVLHTIADGDWLTEVHTGIIPDWFAEQNDIDSPEASALIPAMQGLQIGVVLKIDEDPDGEFRVQVKLPLIENDVASIWARFSHYYASNNAGYFFMPEINDEVVVGFLNNDPRYPIILGSMYSKTNASPLTPDAENSTKAIITKSQLKMTFDDTNKVIIAETPGGNKVTLSDQDKKIEIADENGNTITMSSSGIVIDSAKDITLSATANVNITANQNISEKATMDYSAEGMNVSLTGQTGLTAKGNGTAEISSAGMTTVKGSMVMIN